MSTNVFTARISTRDPHRFDITRQSGDAVGRVFAPSWAILGPALAARHEHDRLMAECLRLAGLPETMVRESEFDYQFAAERVADEAWAAYAPAYRAEMLESYQRHRAQWLHLLGKRRVVLVCYCTDPARCHRTLLAGYLGKLGAEVCGELEEAPTLQVQIPGVR